MATRERRGGHLGAARAVLIALLAALAAGLLGAAAPGAGVARADDKSFSLEALETTAELRTDGSMQVTERWTYDFRGGPFNFGIRSFQTHRNDISQFAAADDQGPLEVIPPDQSESGEWEWKLRQPTSDSVVTYTLTYFVAPIVRFGLDVSEVYWQFVGDDNPGIGIVNIDLRFPLTTVPAQPDAADDDVNVMRAWAHGPKTGDVRLEPGEVLVQVSNVEPGEIVEIRALAPAATFNTGGTERLLPSILAEERSYVADRANEASDRRTGWFLSSLVAAVGALGAGVLWFVGGREQRSADVQGDYWREPLDDPPAVAIANLKRGTVDPGHAIAGTLVDLAQRGYVKIVGVKEERFGPDKVVHHYTWLGKPFGPDVLEYEKDLLEFVFRGATETDSDELSAWARANQTTAKRLLDGFTGGVKAEYRRRGYAEVTRTSMVVLLVAICVGVAALSAVVKSATGHGVGWWGVAIAAAIFGVGSNLLSNRNPASVEAAAKAEGLRRFLKDFSHLEDAPVGHLVLWERYLVYAVALGVSAELVQGLASRLPQLLADPHFGTWYTPAPGAHGRFDGFDRIESLGTHVASASTPNNSGSGGGFSGGGGGGGGGGSAGAR
ncbi:MAG: DUF2207 domain-containing protein [Acidimicrobiales bacterium]